MQEIEIYQSANGQAQVEVQFDKETVWLTQDQMSSLFGRDQSVISRHVRNVFKEGELDSKSNMQKMHIPNSDKPVAFYNLDVIISVGYRVKSKRGTQFRIWATQRLKDYLVQGYAINEKRLEQKQQEVQHLKTGIRILSRAIEEKAGQTDFGWLEFYAKGLRLLDDYDHEALDSTGTTKVSVVYPERSEYMALVVEMSDEFDSAVFGHERGSGFQSAIDQIQQSFDGKELYPTFEEKAATLLYLIVKNHAFTDGNKRIAAACFLLFLKRNNRLQPNEDRLIISNEALASLTIFVAASKPEEMDTVKRLIISILNRNGREVEI